MTASVSHKSKIGRAVSITLAAAVSAAVVAGSVAPASANDFYYNEQFDNQQVFDQQSHDGSRSVYRDDIGRYYIRHGRKQYFQFWDREVHRDPVVQPRRDRNKNVETAIIAGVAGLAIGAIIAGSQPRYQEPAPINNKPRVRPLPRQLPRNAFPDAPTNYQPRVITYEGAFEPWTQSWADWCSDRYRSFNTSNGTYTGYDGVKRFCVVK